MRYWGHLSSFIVKFLPCLVWAQVLIAVPFGYVTNTGNNTVSVIDTTTNTVLKTIHVGIRPIGVAVAPNGSTVYVCNNGENTISVISTATNRVVRTINVGANPVGIAITPDGCKAYVANASDNTVYAINTVTNTIIGDPIIVGDSPQLIAITPDGARAYVSNQFDSTVSVIATATNTVIGHPIHVGLLPFDIAITPDGAKAHVCNSGDATVSVIDTATNTVIQTIPASLTAADQFRDDVGTPDETEDPFHIKTDQPRGVAIAPDGARAYVSIIPRRGRVQYGDKNPAASLIVIDTTTNTILGTPIPVGSFPSGVAITPDGSQAYVCNFNGGSVSVIDTNTGIAVGKTIPVGTGPSFIAIGPAPLIPAAPRKFVGTIKRHCDSYWKKTTLSMKWTKSPSENIDHYEIFASGKLITSIPASARLKFHKQVYPYVRDERLSQKYLHFLHEKYRIRAVTDSGITSPFKKIKIVRQKVFNAKRV